MVELLPLFKKLKSDIWFVGNSNVDTLRFEISRTKRSSAHCRLPFFMNSYMPFGTRREKVSA
jgi:hypothetical protein